ncbi:MAG TPA: trimeric intracellular cation channel family protein [Candidatus Nitrosotenuis sp.]|nr:trimeric intracellular cation channel family protein [Candidatus Nitrosotenuis sp.]
MPDISFAVLIYVFDLFGTMAFAVTGAFKAIEHKSDIVGIIILSIITGVAGGTIRDIIIGRFPPGSISEPSYVVVSVASAIAMFFLYPHLKKHWNLFLKFDAIGLGVFSITGATFAYDVFGLNFLAMAFAGILSAVGGGILRDVFVNEVPIVFVKELYATASFAGVVAFYLLLAGNTPLYIASVVGIIITTLLRLVAMKYNWNVPRAREK